MIQKVSALYYQQQEQYNIEQTDEEPLNYSSHLFDSKFIKELNFQQNCQKKIQRRIKQINNMKTIKEAIYDIFLNKKQQTHLQTYQTTTSGKSNSAYPKQFQYKGHHIKGKLRRRMLNGNTTIIYKNGKEFQGLYENGRMKAGKFDFKNGYQYWGELNGKQFCGKGTLKCPDGKRITAVWRGQKILGRAEIQYPQGDVYYGEVQKFMKHGKGYLFFKTGNKYIGDFKRGEINGYGAYYHADGKVIKGMWRDAQLIEEEFQDSQHEDAIKDTLLNKDNIEFRLNFLQSEFVLASQVVDFQLEENEEI